MRARLVVAAAILGFVPARALAQDNTSTPELTPEQAQKVDLSGEAKKESIIQDVPLEAPPPPPRKKGLVLESSLGALFFAGKFANVAPPAFRLHAQLGWEFFKWLMVFGEGELAFTTTGNTSDETKNRVIPLFGFGGGVRGTIHFTDRVAMYVQANAGAMMADVPFRALTVIGYSALESLGPYLGGRLGLEWYQFDPHIALAISGGPRFAPSFARSVGGDLPLIADAEASLRYTF